MKKTWKRDEINERKNHGEKNRTVIRTSMRKKNVKTCKKRGKNKIRETIEKKGGQPWRSHTRIRTFYSRFFFTVWGLRFLKRFFHVLIIFQDL